MIIMTKCIPHHLHKRALAYSDNIYVYTMETDLSAHLRDVALDSRDDLEIYKWKKTKTLEEMTMRVHRSEFRFYPFSLTDKNEIPVKIVKELVTDGYRDAVMLISTVN